MAECSATLYVKDDQERRKMRAFCHQLLQQVINNNGVWPPKKFGAGRFELTPYKRPAKHYSCTFIAASQRPDGTWRKSRRVKDGYIPPEEVPLYESKGKQFVKNKPLYPPGYTPDVKAVKNKKSSTTSPIPGLVINKSAEGKTNKKKKKKQQTTNVESASEQPVNSSQAGSSSSSSTSTATERIEPPVVNPEKRIKNLRKRLREIEVIQEKIKSGTLKNPERDQLDKISRKSLVEAEIEVLTTLLNNVIVQ